MQAYFILTCGLLFLETSANPYILSMGSEETSTRRLNLAQVFNPIGSLIGMWGGENLHPDAAQSLRLRGPGPVARGRIRGGKTVRSRGAPPLCHHRAGDRGHVPADQLLADARQSGSESQDQLPADAQADLLHF